MMTQKRLALGAKVILASLIGFGCLMYWLVLPIAGLEIADRYPEYGQFYLPWLGFLWLTSLPLLAAVILCWLIVTGIQEDRCFTNANGSRLKWICWLLLGDVVYFLAGNVALLCLGGSHWSVLLLSLVIDFAGLALALVCRMLSLLVYKAAALQAQSELTI